MTTFAFSKALPLSLLTAALVLSGCGSDDNNDTTPITTTNPDPSGGTQPSGIQVDTILLAESNQDTPVGNTDAYQKIIKDQTEFAREFAKFNPVSASLPTVDFTKQQVVMVFLGDQAADDETLTVTPAYDNGSDKVNLIVNREKLASDCSVSDKVGATSIFVLVDTTKPINIINKDAIKTCQDNQMDYQILHQSEGSEAYDDSNSITAYDKVLKNQAEFATEFAKFTDATVPTIDFDQQQVVMATMGTQSSGGSTYGVEQVYVKNDTTHVVLINKHPADDCMVTSVMTVPNIFVAVDSMKPVTIKNITQKQSCS